MIILLNGSINSGKTTVGNVIASRSIGFAHIEADALRAFIPWMPLEETIELNLRNAVAVAKNFHARGIHSVISYPLSKSNYLFVQALLADEEIDVHAVTLYPGIDHLKTNRGARELTDWELTRIDELHARGITRPDFGATIDNSAQTVDETVDEVLKIAGYTPGSAILRPIWNQ